MNRPAVAALKGQNQWQLQCPGQRQGQQLLGVMEGCMLSESGPQAMALLMALVVHHLVALTVLSS